MFYVFCFRFESIHAKSAAEGHVSWEEFDAFHNSILNAEFNDPWYEKK